jgi:pimeloyl-ACP methyl ester carboxylesterase
MGHFKRVLETTTGCLSSEYTVVALDLGGHGQSGHNRENWTIEDFAKDVRAVIDGLHLNNVILVGHSMGGEIILQTALHLTRQGYWFYRH